MAATPNEAPIAEIDPSKEIEHAKDVYVQCRHYRKSTICKTAAEFARDDALDGGGSPPPK